MGCFNSKGGDGAGAKGADAYKEGGSEKDKDISRAVVQGGFTNENFIFNNTGKIIDYYKFDDKMLGQGTYGKPKGGVTDLIVLGIRI